MNYMEDTKMESKKKLKISLTTQILIATVAGIVFGALVGPWAANLAFIGNLFLRLIQMSVVLLVMMVFRKDKRHLGYLIAHTQVTDRM